MLRVKFEVLLLRGHWNFVLAEAAEVTAQAETSQAELKKGGAVS